MSTATIKERAAKLLLQKGSKHELIRKLIVDGFFDSPKTTSDIIIEVRQNVGKRLKSNEIQTYMRKFLGEEIIHAFRDKQHNGNYWILTSVDKTKAARLVGKDSKMQEIENQLFSEPLLKALGATFEIEFRDLQYNFDKSGTCTAFLLRKILEKLIYLAFAKQGAQSKLADKKDPNRLVGLEAMISVAVAEKIGGVPFLTSKTANAIQGMKFLGDTAAHNFLANVDMKTIVPQMPYIITAFEELAKKM
jgi:hypothetical protein